VRVEAAEDKPATMEEHDQGFIIALLAAVMAQRNPAVSAINLAVPGLQTRWMWITKMPYYGLVIDTLLPNSGGSRETRNLEMAVDKSDNAWIQAKLLHYAILTSRFVNGSGRLHWLRSSVRLSNTMDIRRFIPDHAITTIPVLALLFALHYFLSPDDSAEDGIESTGSFSYDYWQPGIETEELDIEAGLSQLELDDVKRDQLIRELLRQGEFKQARTQLLEIAAASMLADDQKQLGKTLQLLGEVAINQQELATAEVYLQESLYLAMSLDDVAGTARSYQLLGQLNIRARELARHAANTYDQLWQARNSIARGIYQGVNDNLNAVIRDNL
jgi:hypothetical protein